MPGDPDPVEEVTGLASSANVSKSEFVSYEKERGIAIFPTADEVRGRDLSARLRIMIGSRFFRKDTQDTSADDDTETSTVVIDAAGTHWVLIEGEKYDIGFEAAALLSDGERLPPWNVITPFQLLEDLPGSIATVDEAPDAEAVFLIRRKPSGSSESTVGSITFASGETEGTFAFAADVSFAVGDQLRIVCPDPRNETLRTFAATIAAVR